MGRRLEELAHQRGDQIVDRWDEADVGIDFSHPSVALRHLEMACEMGKNCVIGTTGWNVEAGKAKALEAGIGAIYAPNFSLGVWAFYRIVEKARQTLPDYDRAGWEIHHRTKVDRPSGTAKALQMDMASVRVGAVPGTHTEHFDGEVDGIEITHRARNRDGVVQGALRAAEWVQGRVGFFSLDDMMLSQELPLASN